jgi:hypothetical protein
MMQVSRGGAHRALVALALLAVSGQVVRAEAPLVLLCNGTRYCSTCAPSEKQVDFAWTYTIHFAASTVDGNPAKISDQTIAWDLNSATVLDHREISRYSKKFHYAGKAVSGGGLDRGSGSHSDAPSMASQRRYKFVGDWVTRSLR